MDLYERLTDFVDSLSEYPPEGHPGGQVADIFNALLAASKEAHPDDPVVAAIAPVKKGSTSGEALVDAGTILTAAEQLRGASKPASFVGIA